MKQADDRERPQQEVGDLPMPEYLVTQSDTKGTGEIPWIGIMAYSLDGNYMPFLWWKNFNLSALHQVVDFNNVPGLVARLKIETGADVAIGPAVDLRSSDPDRKYVSVIPEEGAIGVYVEETRRRLFNFYINMAGGGLKTADEIRPQNPSHFEDLVEKAVAVLPRMYRP